MSEREYIVSMYSARRGVKCEEIVRCRDCKLCVVKGYRLYCDLNTGSFPEVESDGFCAWGERRDA